MREKGRGHRKGRKMGRGKGRSNGEDLKRRRG